MAAQNEALTALFKGQEIAIFANQHEVLWGELERPLPICSHIRLERAALTVVAA
jgi:hypothetical protein